MSSPLQSLSASHRRQRRATGVLLVACLFWGLSFTWGKNGGAAINRAAGLADGSLLGPTWLLAIRFLLAGVVWFALFGRARRGWSLHSLRDTLMLGAVLWAAVLVQQLGLDRTSESVSAFLTSLTILFVPAIQTIIQRRRPGTLLIISVLLATLGIWLLTGGSHTGFGIGEGLGLLCSILYSIDIFALNALAARDDPWRLAGGQFIVVGALCAGACLFLPRGSADSWAGLLRLSLAPGVPWNWLLLALLPTLVSFGSQMLVQPDVDPTRAALIYLMEPVFAAAYAWVAQGHALTAMGLGGAMLILVANGLGEMFSARGAGDGAVDGAGDGAGVEKPDRKQPD